MEERYLKEAIKLVIEMETQLPGIKRCLVDSKLFPDFSYLQLMLTNLIRLQAAQQAVINYKFDNNLK